MKVFIKNTIKKALQRAGVYVQYFPTSKHIYGFLKYKPALIRRYELNRIVAALRTADNHRQYEKLLRTLVPDWQVDIKKAKFVGKGIGEGGLNTYRKVTIGEKLYFEKVYFNSHQHLQTVHWFESHIYNMIKDEITVPLIQKTFYGELITIVYYDYFDLLKIGEENTENYLIQFSKELYGISCKHSFNIEGLELPDSINNFRNHPAYRNRKRDYRVSTRLSEQGIGLESLEESIDQSKCVLTHGDINERNAFGNKVLIDWDSFGIFPIGLDPAFIYYCLLINKSKKADSLAWIQEHYHDVVPEKDWKDFERNFTYFLYIFSLRRFDKGEFKQLEQKLLKRLRKYF